MDDRPETIARADGISGEVVLRRRRRTDGAVVHELIVNGTFLMDTDETSTERLLAEIVLNRLPDAQRVLVGGLGLGYTTAALLESPRIATVDVVEIEPLIVTWLRDGLVPGAAEALSDPRVTIHLGDIRHALRAAATRYDAVLLDVDNGPDFLVRDANADLYGAPVLRDTAVVVRGGGIVAIWSASPSESLRRALEAEVGTVDVVRRVVDREGRAVDYYVYVATRMS